MGKHTTGDTGHDELSAAARRRITNDNPRGLTPKQLAAEQDHEANEEQAAPPRLSVVDPATESPFTSQHRIILMYSQTDAGTAGTLAVLSGRELRYDHARKRWLIWEKHRWRPDDNGDIYRRALRLAEWIRFAAADEAIDLDDDARKKWFGWGLRLKSRPRHEAVVAMARNIEPIADNGKDWDATPGLIGVPNGVVDLKTGELRDGRPNDRITKHAGTGFDFDPDATCPRWERFVLEVLDEDEETAKYVQRLAGYSLTGEASEDKLIFLMGDGGNGKTTLLNVLRTIAGEYAQEVSAMAILEERSGAHTTEVSDLEGSRFATCEEIGDARLNANRMKQLSGGSPITARKIARDTRTFEPTWQLWITTNGMPQANDNARAFWRRVVAIDFPNVFEQSDEPDLEATLTDELPGILAWAVRGAVDYYASGLGDMPEAVAKHTTAYQHDSDRLQPVFEAGYLVEVETDDPEEVWTPVAYLHGAYIRWARATEVPPALTLGPKQFSQALGARFSRDKRTDPDDKTEKRGFFGVMVGEGK